VSPKSVPKDVIEPCVPVAMVPVSVVADIDERPVRVLEAPENVRLPSIVKPLRVPTLVIAV
jgi:hypothetical protein